MPGRKYYFFGKIKIHGITQDTPENVTHAKQITTRTHNLQTDGLLSMKENVQL